MTLLQGDCIAKMRELPAGSVDMVLCDPPYGTTACKWDSVIPFEPMWTELKRICKPNAAICLFGAQPFTAALVMSQPQLFKYEWVWEKDNLGGFYNAKKRPLKAHELISVFYQEQPAYYPQGLIRKSKTRKNTGNKLVGVKNSYGEQGVYGNNKNTHWLQSATNYPTSIVFGSVPRKTVHPTQKPVALLEYLIRTYTQPGETVIDFTMGSGSTGVACVNTDRKFIGIELDEKYFGIAESRIKEAVVSEPLPQLEPEA